MGRERATYTRKARRAFALRDRYMVQARERKAAIGTYGADMVATMVRLARLNNRAGLMYLRIREDWAAFQKENPGAY